ncbi:MAG: F0F1 ATP synthase subunit A [Actinobacteria bacterium]|nr:MAG: F0F1 ATP synthase subunit A [Actinomycetota bacterium]
MAATGSTSLDHRRHQPSSGASGLHARNRRDGSDRARAAHLPRRRLAARRVGDRRDALGREPALRLPARAHALGREPRRVWGGGRRDDDPRDRRHGRHLRGRALRSVGRPGRGSDVCACLHGRAHPLARFLLREPAAVKRAFFAVALLALTLPSQALARGDFDPTTEFEQHEWVPIHIGPLDLSITKAVVYLMLGSVLTIALGTLLMRWRLSVEAGTRQTFGETIYDVAQTQIAEQGLPSKAIQLWFPYVASLFLFIFVVNLLGFIPLPLTGETWHGIPVWGIYAATSSLSVTLALAALTFVFTHFEGIRWNGPVRYFKSWIPDAPKALLVLIVPLEILGQIMRLISLSVRLFANMLAGHILILTFLGLIFIFQSLLLALVVPFAILFYIFEVAIVVGIQAFIFATLSAIYIGSAIEPQH